jgi:hypothetical protein
MPKSTKVAVDKSVLINATLPPATQTYTVISHGYIIDTTLKSLAAAGFVVLDEKYRCNQDARVAQGIYRIEYLNDPDLSMMFTWTNSYDKSTRFRCAVGAHVNASGASMVKKTSAWQRKHTGNALQEATDQIDNIIADAQDYFQELLDIKDKMKQKYLSEEAYIIVTDPTSTTVYPGLFEKLVNKKFGHLMGDLHFTNKLITSEQCTTIMKEYESQRYHYGTGKNSLWTAYNHILIGLKSTHPKLWLDIQTSVLLYFMDEFDLVNFDIEEDDDEAMNSVEDDNTNIIEDATDDNTSVIGDDFDKDLEEVTEEPKEDIQFVPADNVIEETEEVKSEVNSIMVTAEDYGDLAIGSLVEVEDIIYQVAEIQTYEGEDYLVLNEFTVAEEITPDPTPALPDPPVSNVESTVNQDESNQLNFDLYQDDTIEIFNPVQDKFAEKFGTEDETEEESSELNSVNEFLIESTEETVEENQDLDPAIQKAIKDELESLYGYSNVDFTFKRDDEHYLITLSTGESLVLSSSYIDTIAYS